MYTYAQRILRKNTNIVKGGRSLLCMLRITELPRYFCNSIWYSFLYFNLDGHLKFPCKLELQVGVGEANWKMFSRLELSYDSYESFFFTMISVRIWPLHCSLGNQNTITWKLELHAIQLKGKSTSQYAQGPLGPSMLGSVVPWTRGEFGNPGCPTGKQTGLESKP